MSLCTASRGYISALPQWDGAFPHGRCFVGLAVKVLESHDAFNGSAVQHKPAPVPFLQKYSDCLQDLTPLIVYITSDQVRKFYLHKSPNGKFVEWALFPNRDKRHFLFVGNCPAPPLYCTALGSNANLEKYIET